MQTPLEKLDEADRNKVLRIISWLRKYARMELDFNDTSVRRAMTAQGIPGLEAIPFGDLEGGGGTVIMANDGTKAYAFGVWKDNLDKKDNGYAMIQLDAKPLAVAAKLGLYSPTEIIRSIHLFLGFSGTKEQLASLKLFNPSSGN